MLLKALVFSLITFGLTFVVSFIVAAIIKVIGAAIRKRETKMAEDKAK